MDDDHDDERQNVNDDLEVRALQQMRDEAGDRHAELIGKLTEISDQALGLAAIQKTLDWITEQYGERLTADDVMGQVAETTTRATEPYRIALADACAALQESRRIMEQSRQQFDLGARRTRAINDQARQVRIWGGAGLAAGALAMMILPGTLARAAPSSWLLPERLAAHMLGKPMTEAASHLLVAANPRAAAEMVEGAQFMADNRKAIERCRKRGSKTAGARTCKIKVRI